MPWLTVLSHGGTCCTTSLPCSSPGYINATLRNAAADPAQTTAAARADQDQRTNGNSNAFGHFRHPAYRYPGRRGTSRVINSGNRWNRSAAGGTFSLSPRRTDAGDLAQNLQFSQNNGGSYIRSEERTTGTVVLVEFDSICELQPEFRP